MVGKKMEGDEVQRRAAAREAERRGAAPSALGGTTGASKQRTHLSHRGSVPHEERMRTRHRGKQREPERIPGEGGGPDTLPGTGVTFAGRAPAGYTADHERVYRTLVDLERRRGGDGAFLEEVARAAGLSRQEARLLLHDLVATHRLVAEVQGADHPDLGARYETKGRL